LLFPIKFKAKKNMSCPNCGTPLEVPDQRFCQDCGIKLQESSNISELAQNSLAPPRYKENHQLKQTPVKTPTSRPRSKRSLGFGIVSLIIAVITFNIVSSMVMPPFLLPLSGRIILFVSFGIINIVGIGSGIISSVFNAQAKRLESKNTAMKVGSMLGTIGLIFNLILMIVAFFLVVILAS
jgi:uncharacterized membrane protein